MKKNWYAVYTRPKTEKKVASYLNRKRIINFYPVNSVIKNNSFERSKLVEEPLFPSYVFININENEFSAVKQCNDVINLLYWLGRPVQFKDAEIENLKEFSDNYSNIQVEKIKVSMNNMVRIVNKFPFYDDGLNVVQLNNALITLTLPTIGYKLTATANEMIINNELREVAELVVS